MEFAFQLPEGVMGGQKVEVEVPREEKAQVVKVGLKHRGPSPLQHGWHASTVNTLAAPEV